MTQASLSPDLPGALGASPSIPGSGTRPGPASEAALWITALSSTGLVVAALLLLGLLMRNVVTDASLGGFVAGIGIVIAVLGVGGVTYALVSARRAGYLQLAEATVTGGSDEVPAGMRVVPALPPDFGRRRRLELEAERSTRSRQAKAIATAAAVSVRKQRPLAPRRPVTRPVAVTPQNATARPPRQQHTPAQPPQQQRAARPAPALAARPAVAPTRRPAPARPTPIRMAPPPVRMRAPARPAITMPRPQPPAPRPAAWPSRAPVVRMATPPIRPRTQATTFQVNAATVRSATPVRPR